MTLAMEPANAARIGNRWWIGLAVMLFSIVVLAENTARLDISPAYDDYRLTDEIYNNANGWRTPPESDNEWRPENQEQTGRIRFGFDSAYEEMRARGNDGSLNTGSGLEDHPQNSQFKIGF